MALNIENLVRSGVVLVIGLPITIGAVLNQMPKGESATEKAVAAFKGDLAAPCLNYIFSKSDSKLERDAKNQIDTRLGGGASYGDVCKFVLN